ncbi:hypothetical protein N7478_012402 [Penicillium angulare]|uniref:uncharacterized protein n=1 Tax=Penicillium angulare TaxID=116970 RepID=UPI0025414D73|nr:uncharacterized protein N7478_012402 [Penicillium angulare]KAJ5259421.1 hypothetical protein N7478_012402 [Penicillium angulare]
MPLQEKTIPPPLWSSFPSKRLAVHPQPSQETLPPYNKPTKSRMTHGLSFFKGKGKRDSQNPTQSSNPFRNMTPSHTVPSSTSSGTTWDPPAYDDVQYQAPAPEASDSDFAFLAEFDTIFLVDDSSSMRGPRWQEAEQAISAITPICTQYDSDGIDIYFLNHLSSPSTTGANALGGYKNITTASHVQEIFSSVLPRGATPVGKRLQTILQPYVHCVQEMEASREQHGGLLDPSLLVKPVNIIVITDGEFTDDAESVIEQVARKLDTPNPAVPWQVGIQFFQIGNDRAARRYLEELDDNLGRSCVDEKLRDIVDTVPWRGETGRTLDAQGILKCVLGAVNKKLDRRQV